MLTHGIFSPKPSTEIHYAIIANGSFLVREIILEIIEGKKVIALDGAANKLASLKIKPSVILGDFDSIKPESLWGVEKLISTDNHKTQPAITAQNIAVIHTPNPEFTDLVKAIRYADEYHAASIHILCATGGRLDHHEGAMRCLRSEYKKDRMIYLHSEQQTLRFAKDETVIFAGEIDDKCGIVAYPAGYFSSTGLQYNTKDYKLEFGITESICNALKEKSATVIVKGEALLIMPPQFKSQRVFSQKNEIERLELQLRDAKGQIEEEKELNNNSRAKEAIRLK